MQQITHFKLKHAGLAAAAAAAGTLLWPTLAPAHVTAQPEQQPGGAFTKIVFRMPNERPAASVKLEVQLPPELDAVRVAPVVGWDYRITRKKLAQPREVFGQKVTDYVASIQWTGTLGADEFQEFPVSMRLPESGNFGRYVLFPALQTYENGEVVRWIQKPENTDGSFDDLEQPAPRVELAEQAVAQPGSGGGDDGETLATVALVLGGIALAASVASLAWSRMRHG